MLIRAIISISLVVFLFDVFSNNAKAYDLISKTDGSKIDYKSSALKKSWAGKAFEYALQQPYEGFYISKGICPNYWFRTSSLEEAQKMYEKSLEKAYPSLNQYVKDGKCELHEVFNKKKVLQLDFGLFIRGPYLKYTPVTMFVLKDGKIERLKGMVEYQKLSTGKNDVKIFNNFGEQFCTGYFDLSMNDTGSFSLSCVGGSIKITGVAEIRGGGKLHTVGSGVMTTGESFAFVTRLTGRFLPGKYSGINEITEFSKLADVLMKK